MRSEIVWQHKLPKMIRTDRRPLDESDSTPLGGTNPLLQVTTYDFAGMVTTVTLPNGAVVESVADGFGQVFKTVMKESAAPNSPVLETSRSYNNDWLEPTVIAYGQPSGGAATTRWVKTSRNAAGLVVSLTEPTAPAVVGYTGSLGGAAHQFELDALGRVIEERVLDGATLLKKTNLAYDQLGRVMKAQHQVLGGGATGAHWSITTYGAGKLSQVESTEATASPVISYLYDVATGLPVEAHDNQPSGGNRTRRFYLANTPFVERIQQVLVGAATATYETAYTLDRLGRAVQVRAGSNTPTPLQHSYTYTSLGNVDTYTDPLGKVQTFLADALGRTVEHARLGGGSSVIVNTAVHFDTGLASSRTKVMQIDGLGQATVTHRDFAGRPFLIQSPGANYGLEPTAADPNEPHCEYAVYDALSQVSLLCDGDDGQVAMRYDGAGRLILRELLYLQPNIAYLNTKDILRRDALGRITDANMLGAANGVGNPAPWTSAINTSPLVNEAFTVDSIGRTHLEQCQSPFAVNILQVQSTWSNTPGDGFRRGVSLVDNLSGNASAPLGLEFVPDGVGRLEKVRWNRWGSMTDLADYTWLGGQRHTRTVQFGAGAGTPVGASSFGYDAYGRLASILDLVTPAGGGAATQTSRFDYEYDLASNLKKEKYAKVGGWQGDRFKYDAYHRLADAYLGVDTALMAQPPDQDPVGYNAASTKSLVSYALDAANNRDQTTFQQGAGGPVVTDYVLESGSGSSSPSNRYAQMGATLFLHDQRGNLVYDGQFYYRYDFLNRLQEVWRVLPVDATPEDQDVQSGSKFAVADADALEESREEVKEEVHNLMGRVPREHLDPTFRARLKANIRGGVFRVGAAATAGATQSANGLPANLELHALYGYDAFNRRVVRVVIGGETLLTTFDGWRMVAEHQLDLGGTYQAQPVRQYAYGDRLDEILSYRRRVGAAGAYSWETYYLQHGGQDTAAKLLNESGAVVEQYEYDAFGKATIYSAAGTELAWSASVRMPFLWKAVHFDAETGLLWMRNRYYSTVTGRFLTGDPLGAWFDSRNLGGGYCFLGNEPIRDSDPLGLWSPAAHDYMIRKVLGGQLPASAITYLQKEGRMFDARTQDSKFLHMHAMRRGDQSPEDALDMMWKFMVSTALEARAAYQAGDVERAYALLAQALHPAMDMTSPRHAEWDSEGRCVPGVFSYWPNSFSYLGIVGHAPFLNFENLPSTQDLERSGGMMEALVGLVFGPAGNRPEAPAWTEANSLSRKQSDDREGDENIKEILDRIKEREGQCK